MNQHTQEVRPSCRTKALRIFCRGYFLLVFLSGATGITGYQSIKAGYLWKTNQNKKTMSRNDFETTESGTESPPASFRLPMRVLCKEGNRKGYQVEPVLTGYLEMQIRFQTNPSK